ncbi:MAG: DegT/DnrJ/EryC1/StrS family aminotransferase [bacterium]|nr:DegT/DnrJ/EryC1/StrS family aminotransferase [bacterium]
MAYKVRFVNPQKQYADHREEFIKAFDDVLTRGAIVNREDLWQFEEDFAKFVGAKYAVGVNSGTSALDVALQATGIGPGDEVITVAHTFMASISTIAMTGATPVLVDVGRDFNMDVKALEQALTPKTKAILPVHLNGRLCDMEVIMQIAKSRGLMVIEDAAQALGAKMQIANGKWQSAGSFGLVGCFSLYWAKTLGGWGNNGIAVTDNLEIARKLKLMRYNGEDREDRHFYYHAHNLLMDNVQAALLNVKLKYLSGWLERRKEIAARYRERLLDVKQLQLPHFSAAGGSASGGDDARFSDVYTNYVVRAERRNELKKHLDNNQLVETMISWPQPTYTEPVMVDTKNRWRFGDSSATSLPETEKICKEALSLPIYPELTDEEVDYVANAVKAFYSKFSH